MTGAWAELALVCIAIGGPALVAVGWQAWDDRRMARAVDAIRDEVAR
jgi:hypothetical protein